MNDVMNKRICKLVAMSYALSEHIVWQSFTRLNSIDKVIALAKDGTLEKLDVERL